MMAAVGQTFTLAKGEVDSSILSGGTIFPLLSNMIGCTGRITKDVRSTAAAPRQHRRHPAFRGGDPQPDPPRPWRAYPRRAVGELGGLAAEHEDSVGREALAGA